ncbi:MAG: dihydroorotate dehydrogenase electron transfer subunit [Chloroflexota bacterium]
MNQAVLPQPLRIRAVRVENEWTKTFELAGSLAASPGQFVMAWLPGVDEKPFSLAGADPLRLTIAAVGPFTRAVHRLRVGERLWLRGPLGRGFHLPPAGSSHKLLLLGGGYGVAPLHFLARQSLAAGHRVGMVIGARNRAHLLLAADFEALGVPLWLTTEDGSAGQPGLITTALAAILADPQTRPEVVYACGPTGMLAAIAGLCRAEGLPFELAWEAHMRCALGLCGSCEVGRGWLTCLDGPVFDFNPLG